MPDHMTTWIVGTGAMGAAYLAALRQIGEPALVIGRTETNSRRFAEEHNCDVITGGVSAALADHPPPQTAILAASIDQLIPIARILLEAGTRRLLIEKPAALHLADVRELAALVASKQAEAFVAYNRRFYPSVLAAEKLIAEDGGVTSFVFEFTEIAKRVLAETHPPGVLENWFIANSTHVVDLAFFLGGPPGDICCLTGHPLPWHSFGTFAGAGKTTTGALFSYHANWDSGGRWMVELCTPRRRLILRPMESLQVQMLGEFELRPVDLADYDEHGIKPGIFGQTRAFLTGENQERLLAIADYEERFMLFDRIRAQA